MSMSKGHQYINYRIRVTIQDERQLVGKFMLFDRHMNLVLGGCEEFRKLPPSKKEGGEEREDRRTLGLVLLRGEEVISMTVEGPPPPDESRAKAHAASANLAGSGLGRATSRSVPTPPRPGPAWSRRPRPQRRRPCPEHDAAPNLLPPRSPALSPTHLLPTGRSAPSDDRLPRPQVRPPSHACCAVRRRQARGSACALPYANPQFG